MNHLQILIRGSVSASRPKYYPQREWGMWVVYDSKKKKTIFGPSIHRACIRFIDEQSGKIPEIIPESKPERNMYFLKVFWTGGSMYFHRFSHPSTGEVCAYLTKYKDRKRTWYSKQSALSNQIKLQARDWWNFGSPVTIEIGETQKEE